jgi:hypothetical protein
LEADPAWPSGYDGHRRDQRRRVARETTPQERLEWLEEMLFFLWENGLIPSKLSPPQSLEEPIQGS